MIDLKTMDGVLLYQLDTNTLIGYDFENLYLKRLNFKKQILYNTTFTYCNLSGSSFNGVDISAVTFDNCDLSYSNICFSETKNIKFINCNLTGAKIIFTNEMIFEKCNLDDLVIINESFDFDIDIRCCKYVYKKTFILETQLEKKEKKEITIICFLNSKTNNCNLIFDGVFGDDEKLYEYLNYFTKDKSVLDVFSQSIIEYNKKYIEDYMFE